jgi:hypothetical protein
MKKLPLGIQTFSEIITEDYIYVDKTEDIYNLFAGGGKYYFLSRPRRFGKSLLISTLSDLFSGNKELFKGLWIYDKIEWKRHPVIHIDFSGMQYSNKEELSETLNYLLDENAQKYGIELKGKTYDKRFKELIVELSQKERIVVLVDEYDKPIIDFVEEKDTAEANRSTLASFYSTIKAADKHIKFTFLTGVSKFSKVSVFSGLNNLRDITLSRHFPNLLGYTEKELLHYFAGYIEKMAQEWDLQVDLLVSKIREWYNGYSWDGKHFLYNPFSILNLFAEGAFHNFWFSTGTPSFLIKLIKQRQSNIIEFDNLPVSGYSFESYEIDNLEIVPLLFQTGYLTVKESFIKEDTRKFRLSYPNKEVRDSFLTHLFREFTEKDLTSSARIIGSIGEAVEQGDIDRLLTEIKSIFASIPYNIFISSREAYYHTIIYLVLKLAGADVEAEQQTNTGRLDVVLEAKNNIYIMEFKIGSELEALKQIKEKKYHEKFLNSGKRVALVGIGFDTGKRNIGSYILEDITP